MGCLFCLVLYSEQHSHGWSAGECTSEKQQFTSCKVAHTHISHLHMWHDKENVLLCKVSVKLSNVLSLGFILTQSERLNDIVVSHRPRWRNSAANHAKQEHNIQHKHTTTTDEERCCMRLLEMKVLCIRVCKHSKKTAKIDRITN